MKNFNLIEWLQTDSHEKQRVSSMRRYAAMLLLLIITCAHAYAANGDVLFSQNFNSATAVNYAANAAGHLSGESSNNIFGSTAGSQFTSLYSAKKSSAGYGINANSTYDYRGVFGVYANNTGYKYCLAKTTAFAATPPTALKIVMTLKIKGLNGTNNGVTTSFAIGSGFTDATEMSSQKADSIHSAFTLNGHTTGHYICSYNTTTSISSTNKITDNTEVTVTWIINNTGSTLSYTNPNSTSTNLNNDKFDVWVGTTKFVDGQAADHGGQRLRQLIIGDPTGKKHEFVLNDITVTDLTPGAACTAPNHVDISGTWGRFGGEDIELTAAAYSSAGTGSPIADANITGWQWQKLIGSTWTNVSNGTSAGVTTSGATSKNLVISGCGQGNSGKYRCVVSTGATCSTPSATATDGSEGFGVKVYTLECYTDGTTSYNFTRDGNNDRGSVEVDLAARAEGHEFKIHADDYYGATGNIYADEDDWVFTTAGDNVNVHPGLGGTFTFTIDYSSNGAEPLLEVTYPRKTVYLVPNSDWISNSAKFAFYYWGTGDGNNGWTSFLSASVCDAAVYPASIPQWDGLQIIGVRFDPSKVSTGNWDKKWNQTQDLTLSSNDKVAISDWNSATYNSNYAAPTYTISFAANGGSGTMTSLSSIACDADKAVTANSYTKTGYSFAGWKANVDVKINGSTVSAGTVINDKVTIQNIRSNITLTAQWSVNSYNLTWNLGGGTTTSAGTGIASGVSVNTTSSVAYGASLKAPTVAKANYTFSAWSPAVESKMPAANTTYTATFTANQYSVTHTLTGVTTSSGATGSNAATYGTNYSATFAASSGYELPSSVTVTAGGSDITASCTYTKGTGTVVIPGASITGNIVITVTGTYAANFQMIANSSAASEATLANNESISQGSKNCATLTGGTAVYSNADGDSKSMKVAKPSSGTQYGWYFNVAKDVITITLTSHVLQVGSVITFSGYVGSTNYGISVNGSTTLTKSGSSGEFTKSYTVTAGDTHLIGKNVLELKRENGSAKMYSFTLSNCQAASPCTTPTLPSLSNQAGCSYSAWNATPSNESTISAAGESISYSWKKGATEKATTASYTPDADGTDYTVTVTVSKAGKISTSVTSSALTATKYGNPTVTGPSDAEYEVGESASNLSVTATPTHGETLTYQWYSNTAKSTSSPTPTALANCTTSTYKPSTAAAATTYYFCKVSGGCADVYSSIATVTVSEPPCMEAEITKSSGSYTLSTGSGETKDITSDATVTSGGAVKLVNNYAGSKSFSFSENGVAPGTSDGYVEIVFPSGSALDEGSIIHITGAGTEEGAGLLLIDDDGNTIASQTNNGAIDFSYTVTAISTLKYKNHVRIKRAKASSKNHFKSVTVTGCVECTPITPSLSYSKTTFWMDDATLTATPTLTGYYGSPTISYASSDPTVVRVDNSSTGAITALKRGTATITATIGATTVSTTDYCGNTATCVITVKDMECGNTTIAKATRSGTSASYSGVEGGSALENNLDGSNYKLKSGGYVGVQLPSTLSFEAGDIVRIDLTIGDWWNGASADELPVVIYADNSGTNEIYRTDNYTKLTAQVVEFEVTSSMLTALASKQVTVYRQSSTETQNHVVNSVEIKRYGCPDVYVFDAADNGLWSDEDNWIGATGHGSGIPTIEDRAIITKPITVDIAHATAAAVILDQSDSKTGKLTIEANKGLEVAGTVTRTTDGSNSLATREEDLVLESSSAGNASLIFDNSNGCEATVMMYSKASINRGTNTWNWQYVGTPFTGSIPSYNYYGSWMYKWNGGWEVVHGNDELTPFAGYCLTQESATTHVMGGTLVPTTSKSVTMAASTDMVLANSWTAAISIASFDIEGGDATFTSTPATIYLFNTGSAEDGSEAGSEAGTYIAVPINSAPYTGNGLIAPMQGFFVTTNGGNAGTITMNYDALVRPSGSHTDIVAGPMKAPRRAQEADNKPAVLKMWANGSEYNDRVVILEREDFSEGFDNGWDGEKMSFGNASPSVYVINAQGGYDAVSAIPTLEGTVVGFRAGADSQYTMTFSYEGEDEWYLNDLQTETSTLISGEQTYSFAAEKEDSEVRFVISKTPIQKVPTGVEDAVSGQQSAVRKVLINDHIYIIRGGRIYSADGQLVK